MWQNVHLPAVVPFPDIAVELFQYFELAALVLGLFTAIILFAKSKTKDTEVFFGVDGLRRFLSSFLAYFSHITYYTRQSRRRPYF
jgi:hypothetical protein